MSISLIHFLLFKHLDTIFYFLLFVFLHPYRKHNAYMNNIVSNKVIDHSVHTYSHIHIYLYIPVSTSININIIKWKEKNYCIFINCMVAILKKHLLCDYVLYMCVCAPVCESTSAHMFCTESPRLIGALSQSLMGCGESSSTSLCKI